VDWRALGPRISTKLPLGALRSAYARSDIIALDLDQCIFPGYSQTALGERIAWRLLRRPAGPGERRLLPRLCLGGARLALSEAKRCLGFPTAASRLMAWYERAMRGVPERYFAEAARELPARSYPFAAETVALLAEQACTGIVTLGLDVVARAYVEAFQPAEGQGLGFFDSNVVAFREGARGVRVFHRYAPEHLMASGEDKRRALERRMAARGATVPTTIGHSEDDVPLARLAAERGGLAVGFNPAPRLWEAFDAVVTGRDWEAMYALAAILSGAQGSRAHAGAVTDLRGWTH